MKKMAVLEDQHCTMDVNPSLSESDRLHLEEFEEMRDLLRDRTRGVAERYQHGCYVTGRPGTSKTVTICEVLRQIDVPHCYRNSRMSPLGLYSLLEEHPDHVIVLDDIPSLVRQRQAQQILMAALGGRPGEPRPVPYTTKNKDERTSFQFRGGIIAISNLPLRRDPLADAVASRVVLLDHEPTDEMLRAFMRSQALQGYKDLTPQEAWVVLDFVINESRASDYCLDLRIMEKAWQDYRQFKHGKSLVDWHTLVRSSMQRILADQDARPIGRADRKAREHEIVRKLLKRFPKQSENALRIREWKRLTDKGYDSYRRRVREIEAMDSEDPGDSPPDTTA